ncbi:Abscisic acid receptor [Quillaja saponaria]|uniref:Abscisic acid receptor n=1 Tax=Quillaja saponaria TaxID=32244 RepID=A0AAD7LTG8_QUISA|nr:Abscisic acid receptor [Quillaja saponaria]
MLYTIKQNPHKMSSPLQIQRFNPTNNAALGAIASGVNCPKQSQTLLATRRLVVPITFSSNVSVPESMASHHAHMVGPNQCCSAVVQTIDAPVSTVWSVVRRFDNPQVYKHFVKSCHVIDGRDGVHVGTLREIQVISGLPAVCSTERLEILDDEQHIISFSVVGGDHRLRNYRSVTTLHSDNDNKTVVVESYVVDIPTGNTKEETCVFVDTIVRCNLQSLAQIAENKNRQP